MVWVLAEQDTNLGLLNHSSLKDNSEIQRITLLCSEKALSLNDELQ